MATDKDILDEALEEFRLSSDAEEENRAEFLDDVRFARLGEQWPDAIKTQREQEGRPCLTINRLPSFFRQVVNDARQNKPAIKVRPADDAADPETAEIMSGLIRNIEYTSDAEVAYDTALEAAVVGGFGYFRITAEYAHDDTFDLDLCIRRIVNPLTVIGDENSTAADSSDWNKAFVTEMMTNKDFERKYKGAAKVDWADDNGYAGLKQPWAEGNNVLVAEYWKRWLEKREIVRLSDGTIMDGKRYLELKELFDYSGLTVVGTRETDTWKVCQYLMTGVEVLEKNDWAGKYIPIIPVYGDEVNIEGKRYFRSMTRDAKDAQRMFNYWRTTSTELVALAPRVPFIGPKGAFSTDAEKWANANTRSYAYLEYDGNIPPQRQPLDSGGAVGAMQESLAASDDMKAILGIYDASLGARSNETSGIAIRARQREGDVSTFHYIDNLSRAIRHAGRVLIDLIPHVYTGERIIRIIGPEDDVQNIQIGQEQMQPQPMQQPEGSDDMAAIPRVYNLSNGKYDLVVDAGPSFTTKREEAAAQMTEMIRAFPGAAPMMMDILAKNLDWPGADEVAKRFRPPNADGPDPAMMQAQQQMQQMMQAIQELQRQLAATKQDKMIEARKVDVDAFNAETNRLKVTQPMMGPEQVQAMVLQTLQQVLNSPDVLQPPMPQGQMIPQDQMMPGQMMPQGAPVPQPPPMAMQPPMGGIPQP